MEALPNTPNTPLKEYIQNYKAKSGQSLLDCITALRFTPDPTSSTIPTKDAYKSIPHTHTPHRHTGKYGLDTTTTPKAHKFNTRNMGTPLVGTPPYQNRNSSIRSGGSIYTMKTPSTHKANIQFDTGGELLDVHTPNRTLTHQDETKLHTPRAPSRSNLKFTYEEGEMSSPTNSTPTYMPYKEKNSTHSPNISLKEQPRIGDKPKTENGPYLKIKTSQNLTNSINKPIDYPAIKEDKTHTRPSMNHETHSDFSKYTLKKNLSLPIKHDMKLPDISSLSFIQSVLDNLYNCHINLEALNDSSQQKFEEFKNEEDYANKSVSKDIEKLKDQTSKKYTQHMNAIERIDNERKEQIERDRQRKIREENERKEQLRREQELLKKEEEERKLQLELELKRKQELEEQKRQAMLKEEAEKKAKEEALQKAKEEKIKAENEALKKANKEKKAQLEEAEKKAQMDAAQRQETVGTSNALPETFPSNTDVAVARFFDLIKNLNQFEETEVKQITQNNDPQFKKVRVDIKREINTVINQVASTKNQLKQNSNELVGLFQKIGRQTPQFLNYSIYTCIQMFFRQCEVGAQIDANPASVWGYSHLLKSIFQKNNAVGEQLEAYVYKLCCYTVPLYFRKPKSMSLTDFNAIRKQRNQESEEHFQQRMAACLRLWLSFLVSIEEYEAIFTWFNRFYELNTAHNARKIAPITLLVALEVSGYSLQRYNSRTLSEIVQKYETNLLPKLKAITKENSSLLSSIMSRLEHILNTYRKMGKFETPNGMIMKNQEKEADPRI